MDEKLVRDVAETYLRNLSRPFSSKRGAGPDILSEGTAIEIKGRGLRGARNRARAIKQFTQYAIEHKGLEIFLPLEVLDLQLARALWAIEVGVSRAWKEKTLVIYVVTEVEGGAYAVKKFGSAKDLAKRVEQALEQELRGLAYDVTPSLILPIAEMTMSADTTIRDALQREAATHWTKVELEGDE